MKRFGFTAGTHRGPKLIREWMWIVIGSPLGEKYLTWWWCLYFRWGWESAVKFIIGLILEWTGTDIAT